MTDLDEVKAMVTGGMTVGAIAEELGVSVPRASRLISALGLDSSVRRKSAVARLSEEEIEDAIGMYMNGDPVAAIILRYNLNYNAFYKLLSDRGIEFRERSPEMETVRRDRKDLAVRLYIRGLPLAQIEMETGIRQPVLHRELHLRGVPLRRGRGIVSRPVDEDDLFDINDFTDKEAEMLQPEDDTSVAEVRKKVRQQGADPKTKGLAARRSRDI